MESSLERMIIVLSILAPLMISYSSIRSNPNSILKSIFTCALRGRSCRLLNFLGTLTPQSSSWYRYHDEKFLRSFFPYLLAPLVTNLLAEKQAKSKLVMAKCFAHCVWHRVLQYKWGWAQLWKSIAIKWASLALAMTSAFSRIYLLELTKAMRMFRRLF